MNKQLTSEQVAYCGLLCGLCQPGNACGCRANNHWRQAALSQRLLPIRLLYLKGD